MDLGIAGKAALVMGGSRGIGRAVADELAAAGARVAIVARSQDSIDTAVGELRDRGHEAIGISADLSDLDRWEGVVAEVRASIGAPDIAIFNPPTPMHGTFFDRTEADFAASFNDLVLCFGRMVRCVAPAMRERNWGRIVTIGAGCTKQPMRGQLNFAYALANTMRVAAVTLCKTISFELAPYGITINTIATGAIETGTSRDFFGARAAEAGISNEQFMAALTAQVPVGRIGQPHELASLVAYLCSTRAAYTTGETILCDGGIINCTI